MPQKEIVGMAALLLLGSLLAAGRVSARETPQEIELPQDAVLIVIDVQEGWNDASWGPRNNPQAEEKIAKLQAAWRKSGRPLIHVQHRGLGKIKEQVKPLDGEPVVEKRVHSALIGTDLQERLKKDNRKTLVIAGITTDLCVSATARMAGNLGFKTYVVSDACATFDRKDPDGKLFKAEDVHAVHLASLAQGFARIVKTEDLIMKAAGSEKE